MILLRICARRVPKPIAGFDPTLWSTSSTSISPLMQQRLLQRCLLSTTASRNAPKDTLESESNPLVQAYMKKRHSMAAYTPKIEQGDLASDSIFETDRQKQLQAKEKGKEQQSTDADAVTPLADRNPLHMRAALDPDPRKRQQWERKMVIRMVRRRGRFMKAEMLKRTERESLMKSEMLKTSIKKLTKIARQIAGKPVDDAIVQMRFSKKKVAQDVIKVLEKAKATAIVERGMGLGKAEGNAAKPVKIELKDGKQKVVNDPTDIYVDQAWVGRGKFTKEVEYRGRGRANILRKPFTSISVLLKEEATRIRLDKERQDKRRRRKLWVQLPDRPVTAQRQYCLW